MGRDIDSPRFVAATEACRTLLVAGKKWRLSPYLRGVCQSNQEAFHPTLVPVYQSPVLDLICQAALPPRLAILDCGVPAGLGIVATLDVLAAWQTACALFDLPTNLEQVELSLYDSLLQPKVLAIQSAFAAAVESRSTQLQGGAGLAQVAQWARQPIGRPSWDLPTLALVPQHWLTTSAMAEIARRLPTGSVIVALAWEGDGHSGSVYQWRRNFLANHLDFVSLGPCGQEFGNQLPAACDSCFPGRREYLHYPGLDDRECIFAWSYAMVGKSPTLDPTVELKPTIALPSNAEIARANLRYMGTIREKRMVSEHPDTAVGDPGNKNWAEYLKVCPGNSGKVRLAIKRRAAMQVPPLRFGQVLALENLLIQTPYPGHPELGVIDVRNEASLHSAPPLPKAETFLPAYTLAQQAAIDECFYRLFGYPTAYPFQHQILRRVLQGRNLFSIVATGGGKSECYILPALLLPGITIVVSPLKSLMQDQYEQRIRDRYGVDHLVTFINGDIPFYEREARLRRMVLGHYRLIYVTPEQLEQSYLLTALHQADQKVGVRYLALDEAHCISQWGHDFRPSYLNIIERLLTYGIDPVRIALTATASPLVRDDVCQELGLSKEPVDRGGDVFVDSSNRPELNLVVLRCKSTEEKAEQIIRFLKAYRDRGSSIVFMPYTGGSPNSPQDFGVPKGRSGAENEGMVSPGVTAFARYVEAQLREPIAMYHGSLDDDRQGRSNLAVPGDEETPEQAVTRQDEQRAFMSGQKRIMIATKGFGMGIDKPDIRLVIHRSPPANLEAYAQEAGRAGRDKQQATVVLLFSEDKARIMAGPSGAYISRDVLPSDREIQQYFIEQNYVRREDVEAVLAFLRSRYPDRIGNGLYFTNDQIVAVLDRCATEPQVLQLDSPYRWPEFTYRDNGNDASEYWRIHRRGQEYKAKREYVQRVLDVIFNNRPTLNNKVVPAVLSVHRVETLLIDFRLYNPDDIIASPAYFGRVMREGGITAQMMRMLLPNGDRVDITGIAQHLKMSLRDTLCMLRDIRYYQGKTGTRREGDGWVGTLLDFRRAEAPRRVNMTDPYNWRSWREYAGASRGVKPPQGRTDLDDYFPAYVVNKPWGWEVIPGPGLNYPDPETYLNAFMTLHDQRRDNDRSNFSYLLDRYIGSDGHPTDCLRSLLLGYMKTSEVVVGGKCYSCSVCVPDLNFERYPVEIRSKTVVRLNENTIALAEQIEESGRSLPTATVVNDLLAAISEENRQGRSGTAYLDSWLTRLIQDDSQHIGAHRCRLAAAESGLLTLRPEDALSSLEQVAEAARTEGDLAYAQRIAMSFQSDARLKPHELRLVLILASLARRQKQWQTETRELRRVMALTQGATTGSDEFRILQESLSRLLDLFQPGGPTEDPMEARRIARATLQLPGIARRTAEKMYRLILPGLSWQDVLVELQAKPTFSEIIISTWLSASTLSLAERQSALDWLAEFGSIWTNWASDTLLLIKRRLVDGTPISGPLYKALGGALVDRSIDEKAGTEMLLSAWLSGQTMEATHWKAIACNLASLDARWFRNQVLTPAGEKAKQLLAGMLEYASAELPTTWHRLFPSAVMLQLNGKVAAVASRSLLMASPADDEAMANASELAFRVGAEFWDSDMMPFLKQNSSAALRLLRYWANASDQLEMVPTFQNMIAALLSSLLKAHAPADKHNLVATLDKLSTCAQLLTGKGLVPACLDAWLGLKADAAIWPLLQQSRIEGNTLVSLTKRWLVNTDKPHRLDLLVIIMRDVRRSSPRNWLTPVSLEFQALCAAGRFREADNLINEFDELRIGGYGAGDYLRRAKTTIAERSPQYSTELEALWRLMR